MLGRRKSIFIGSMIMVVGAILQFTAYSLPQFVVGRLICGFGNGINTSTVPVWQAECSKPHRRGLTIAFDLALVLSGDMIAYWVDFGMSFTEPSSIAWRFPVALQLVFALFVAAAIFLMPESPRWLILKDRDEDAVQVLEALNDVSPDHPLVLSQLQAIKATLLAAGSASFKHLWTSGPTKHLHRTVLAYVIQVAQQLTGINVITYYATTIYQEEIGLSPFNSRLLSGCTFTAYFLSSFPSLFTMERFGRRTLLLSGSVGMAISMIMMAIMMSVHSTGTGVVAAIFIFVYNFFYASTWNAASWLYPAEILPLSIRVQANALAVSANWIFGFMVVMVSPVMFNSIGWRTYIIYAVFNVAILPLIYFCYPETAYRSLEEMDIIFAKSNGVHHVVKVARAEPRHFDKHGEMIHDMATEVQETVLGIHDEEKDAGVRHLERIETPK